MLQEGIGIILRLLSPIAPHVTHSLWRELGLGDDIQQAGWPQVDESALVSASITYVVQVNGKMRGRITVAANAADEDIRAAVLAEPNVQRFMGDKQLRKMIIVPGRLVNVVVGQEPA